MNDDLPREWINPAHRQGMRLRTKLILGIVIVLAIVGILGLALFGPNPSVLVSPQTTYITSPLAADGLPNYGQALLDEQRRGLTPENNGAALFWRAIGPGSVGAEHFNRLCQDLQINPPPAPPYLVDASGREMRDSLRAWVEDAVGESGEYFDADAAVEEFFDQTSRVAWTAADCPPLAAWVDANEAPLDLLVAAAAKPRFYSPPPNFLDDPNESLISMLLPAIQEMRAAARSLTVRAAYRVGQGSYDDAWQDCLACWRLGERAGEGATVVERLVGLAIRGVARNPTMALLERDDLPEAIAQQVLNDLNALAPRTSMADAIDRGERFMYLDSVLRAVTGRFGGFEEGFDQELGSLQNLSLDPNVPLRMGNEWYDRIVAAMRHEDRAARKAALARVDNDVASLTGPSPSRILGGAFSRQSRSTLVGERLVGLFLPAMHATMDAADRDAANLALTRIAAALAVFRAQTGAYPDTLAELAPKVLATIPVDSYSNQPPIYRRRDQGYVLYSVFQNGRDDGGRDTSGEIIDGEWVAAGATQEVSFDESDYVIRVPHPPLRPPTKSVSQ